jgi:hypothetical protein
MSSNISNVNIPKSPFLDTQTNRPSREWLLYLLGLGRYFGYGAFQNTANQTFATANTPNLLVVNTTDYANGMYYQTNDGFHVLQNGIYNVQYSLQMVNTSTSIHEVDVWLRKNGVDVDGTATIFSIPNKHGGTNGYGVPVANFYVQLNAGDYVELWASVSDTALSISAIARQTSPYARPLIPSTVITVNQVSF